MAPSLSLIASLGIVVLGCGCIEAFSPSSSSSSSWCKPRIMGFDEDVVPAAAQGAGREQGLAVAAAAAAAAAATAAASATDEDSAKPLDDPTCDDDDRAAQVKADAYARQREQVLSGLSVDQAIETFYRAYAGHGPLDHSQFHPLAALSQAIGANYDRIQAYFNGAAMQTKKKMAGILFKTWFDGDFSDCVVLDVGPSLEPLFKNRPTATTDDLATDRTIDMGFLQGLRLQGTDEQFLIPTTVYVRDCMRTIFGLFAEDVGGRVKPEGTSTVLIGSPGVGSSLLFFLAALYQAQTKMTVFYRITKANQEKASMFVMTPEGDGRTVRVWFSRNLDPDKIDQLASCRQAFESELNVHRRDYHLYIDGPHYTEEQYLLDGTYDYFCTSGGFPRCNSAETGKRLWVLDGWTRDEAVDGIMALQMPGVSRAQAERAYWMCGGRIRDMITACEDPEKMIESRKYALQQPGVESMAMALLSSYVSTDACRPDVLRTMFMVPSGGGSDVMDAVQIVDSAYCLGELTRLLNVDAFLRSYDLCRSCGMTSGAGSFFERIIHRTVMDLSQPPATSVCSSKGTAEASVRQLKESGVYWMSSGSHLVSVDAALVHHQTLYSFIVTVADEHDFDVVSFRDNFVITVQDTFKGRHSIEKLVLYVVVPPGSQFHEKQLHFTDGTKRLDEEPDDIEVRIHRVDLKPPRRVSLLKSIGRLWEAILQETSRGGDAPEPRAAYDPQQ